MKPDKLGKYPYLCMPANSSTVQNVVVVVVVVRISLRLPVKHVTSNQSSLLYAQPYSKSKSSLLFAKLFRDSHVGLIFLLRLGMLLNIIMTNLRKH